MTSSAMRSFLAESEPTEVSAVDKDYLLCDMYRGQTQREYILTRLLDEKFFDSIPSLLSCTTGSGSRPGEALLPCAHPITKIAIATPLRQHITGPRIETTTA